MLFNVNTQPLFIYQLLQKMNLKVASATFWLVCFLSLNESTCQTRKNAFYFPSKALFVLDKINFGFWIFRFDDIIKYLSINQEIHFIE